MPDHKKANGEDYKGLYLREQSFVFSMLISTKNVRGWHCHWKERQTAVNPSFYGLRAVEVIFSLMQENENWGQNFGERITEPH